MFSHNKDLFSSFYTQTTYFMDKQLHSFLPSDSCSNSLHDPHHTIQQSVMEEEFASEIALLQTHKLNPRPEAVAQLLDMIAHSGVARQH